MSIPPPLSVGDFSRPLSGSVRYLLLLLNCHMQEKTSGIQGTSQGICHNTCRFLYLLLNIFFRDLHRPWLHFRWLIFCRCSSIRTDCVGISNLSLTLSFTKTRILTMGDNYSLPHILSFDSSSNGEGTHHKAPRTSTW